MPFNGRRMRELRIKRGLTQTEMGKRLGLNSYQTIARYEKGKVEPKVDRLEQIAEILDCSADYLLDLSNTTAKYGPEIDAKTIELARRLMKFPEETRNAMIGITQPKKRASNKH